MASIYKNLASGDKVSTRTLLHEAIPITGTIVSGTYSELNIKNPSHGMYQAVYDYPFLSSSANHIFDITVGIHESSPLYSSISSQQSKKKNVYNQMAQTLVGYDITGSILKFDRDGDLTSGAKMDNVFIIPFSRLLVKDQIKKGTFSMTLGCTTDGAKDGTAFGTPQLLTITDTSGSDQYFVNSPVGEYGILYATGAILNLPGNGDVTEAVGLLYYQAGVAVITSSVFSTLLDSGVEFDGVPGADGDAQSIDQLITGSSIQNIASAVRSRIGNIQFNNTTELNSTIYFARVNHNEFNYSTNPTYLTGSKVRVKTNSTDEPISYITTVGLYSDDNALLAVAKLSEPLKKTPSTEFTLRCRLDY